MRYFHGFFLVALCCASTIFADNYSQWGYGKNIVINTKSTGSGVANTLRKVPLLIRLTSVNAADVFDSAQANGQDIRFSGTDGRHLPYQIERWNKAGKLAELWVLADSVKGNDSSVAIKMLWGNTTAADSSNSKAVFDTTYGFQAVYHLSEATGDSAYDATINRFNGTAKDSSGAGLPKDTVGMIGRGKAFNGSANGSTGGYFLINNSAAGKINFPQDGNYSVSAWVSTDQLASAFKTIVAKNDKQYTLNLRSDNKWEFNVYNPTLGWQDAIYASTAQTWSYLAGVRNGTAEYLYLNGAQVSATPVNNAPNSGARATTTNVCIGRMPSMARFWQGKMDEIRLENVTRSTDWVKLNYENQKAAQTLVTLGASTVSTAISGTAHNATTVYTGIAIVRNTAAQSILFRLSAASANGLTLRITDIFGRVIGRTSVGNSQTAGSIDFSWNRRNASGQLSARGLYFAQVLKGSTLVACKAFCVN